MMITRTKVSQHIVQQFNSGAHSLPVYKGIVFPVNGFGRCVVYRENIIGFRYVDNVRAAKAAV